MKKEWNYIVGFFPTASHHKRYPSCCGARYWFTHQANSSNVYRKMDAWSISWSDTYDTSLSSSFGYSAEGAPLEVKVYDPTRDLIVSASVYHVSMSSGKPVITTATVLSGSATQIYSHVSGSNPNEMGLKCIKLLA